jgi:D-glycero-D-manno-heptose 1,7-bisphosphate phosphatase
LTRRFALIDRDGTLIVEKHYLSSPDQVELIAGAALGLKRLLNHGWGVCLVSNQSGIARGYFDMEQLGKVHQRLAEMLAQHDVTLDGIYLCPHSPDDHCNCRKPMPGMVHQAMVDHGLDPRLAWVIGDKEVDVELGHAVGAKSVLVRTGYGRQFESDTKADFVADDLEAGVDLILNRTG